MIQAFYQLPLLYKHKSKRDGKCDIKETGEWHEVFTRQCRTQFADLIVLWIGVGIYATYNFGGANLVMLLLSSQAIHFHALLLCVTFRNLRLIIEKRGRVELASSKSDATKH
jgi:hypothetical protein